MREWKQWCRHVLLLEKEGCSGFLQPECSCEVMGKWHVRWQSRSSEFQERNHTDRNSSIVLFLWDMPPRDWRRLTFPPEEQRRLLFASLQNLSFPNISHSFCSVRSLPASWLGCTHILQLQDPERSAYSFLATCRSWGRQHYKGDSL